MKRTQQGGHRRAGMAVFVFTDKAAILVTGDMAEQTAMLSQADVMNG